MKSVVSNTCPAHSASHLIASLKFDATKRPRATSDGHNNGFFSGVAEQADLQKSGTFNLLQVQ